MRPFARLVFNASSLSASRRLAYGSPSTSAHSSHTHLVPYICNNNNFTPHEQKYFIHSDPKKRRPADQFTFFLLSSPFFLPILLISPSHHERPPSLKDRSELDQRRLPAVCQTLPQRNAILTQSPLKDLAGLYSLTTESLLLCADHLRLPCRLSLVKVCQDCRGWPQRRPPE